MTGTATGTATGRAPYTWLPLRPRELAAKRWPTLRAPAGLRLGLAGEPRLTGLELGLGLGAVKARRAVGGWEPAIERTWLSAGAWWAPHGWDQSTQAAARGAAACAAPPSARRALRPSDGEAVRVASPCKAVRGAVGAAPAGSTR